MLIASGATCDSEAMVHSHHGARTSCAGSLGLEMANHRRFRGLVSGAIALSCLLVFACGGSDPTITDPSGDAGADAAPPAAGQRADGGDTSSHDAAAPVDATQPPPPPSACPNGTWGDGATCTPWTICGLGSYQAAAPSSTADRRCAGCPTGSFSVENNSAECIPWRTCQPGTFVANQGSATSNRVCSDCAAGSFSTESNQSSCLPSDACRAGTVQTVPATSTTPATCARCEVGTYCAGGTAAKILCPNGTWDHDNNSATACGQWTTCVQGTHVSSDGTPTSDRQCTACASGSFTSAINAGQCTAWRTCAAGTHETAPGTSQLDRQCAVCAAGTYCSGGTSAPVACAANTWDDDGNAATPCVPWQGCGPGSYQVAVGSTTTDRTCGQCPAGQTSSLVNETSCVAAGSPMTAGLGQTCTLIPDGTVSCWGYNDDGELGDGTTTSRSTPATIAGLSDVAEIAAGNFHTCALSTNGTVKCWGLGSSGALGFDSTGAVPTPTTVPGLDHAIAIAAGGLFTCALIDDGTVRCFGDNNNGQLGNGTMTDSTAPVTVTGLSHVLRIAAGDSHACAFTDDNSVKCWGRNAEGQLGDGTTTDSATPRLVTSFNAEPIGITLGAYHSCALLANTQAECWGGNGSGELGDGTTNDSSTPRQVTGLGGVTKLASGSSAFHTCAVLSNAKVWCWGSNNSGCLGDNTTTDRSTPVPVSNLSSAVGVGLGNAYSCAWVDAHHGACWGSNNSGQLGDGTVTDHHTAIAISW